MSDIDKLSNGDHESTVVIVSGDSIVHRLPGGEDFDITAVPGFLDLRPICQAYLERWYNSNMQVTLAAVLTGCTPHQVKEWRISEPGFADVESIIKSIYTEGLQSIHFTEALTNSKIRGQVLRSLKAEGYEDKASAPTTQNNLYIDAGQYKGGIADMMKQLKG